jgi:hypothetical protein
MINEYGAVGGMRIGRGNRNTRSKPAPVPLCPPKTPTLPDLGLILVHRLWKPANNRLSYVTALIALVSLDPKGVGNTFHLNVGLYGVTYKYSTLTSDWNHHRHTGELFFRNVGYSKYDGKR